MPSTNAATPSVTATIVPPQGWFDRTMIVHTAPLTEGQAMAANIVVARDGLPAEETFAAYCARQAKVFASSLPAFVAGEQRSGILHERNAVQMNFSWASSAGELRQQVSFIDAGEGVVVTFTASAASTDFDAHRDVFNAQLAALKIVGGEVARPLTH